MASVYDPGIMARLHDPVIMESVYDPGINEVKNHAKKGSNDKLWLALVFGAFGGLMGAGIGAIIGALLGFGGFGLVRYIEKRNQQEVPSDNFGGRDGGQRVVVAAPPPWIKTFRESRSWAQNMQSKNKNGTMAFSPDG